MTSLDRILSREVCPVRNQEKNVLLGLQAYLSRATLNGSVLYYYYGKS